MKFEVIVILLLIIFVAACLLLRSPSKDKRLVDLLENVILIQLNEHRMYSVYRFEAEECMFVGDIRGCLISLLIVLDKYNSFKERYPNAHIVFLGDYVGGGPCSLACLKLILELKRNDPFHVHLCRGNHEDIDIYKIDEPEGRSVLPDLIEEYGERKAYYIYPLIGEFYASLSPCLILNGNVLCCHGMIHDNFLENGKFNFKPSILKDPFLTSITWSNYPKPIAEEREYGSNVSPEELQEKCRKMHITKVIKGHDYSGAGNRMNGMVIDVNIIISSLWKNRRTTFYTYNDASLQKIPSNEPFYKHTSCIFMVKGILHHSPFLEYEDKIYMYSLIKRMDVSDEKKHLSYRELFE